MKERSKKQIHKAKWKQANNQLWQEISLKYWGNEREELLRLPRYIPTLGVGNSKTF
jgi:hypothetical protein